MQFEINTELVNTELSKLKKLNYNKFRWWRRYDTKIKPSPKNTHISVLIKYKELELSHYFWMIKKVEMDINDMYEKYKNDYGKFTYESSLLRSQRRRLIEDFERDENERLKTIQKGIMDEFDISLEQYENELFKFEGTLEEFYIYLKKKY
jgi:hypothetical protein